jgi:hypothetical protein
LRLFAKRESCLAGGTRRVGLLTLVLLTATAVAIACGGGDNKDAEQVLQRFMEIGQNPGATAEVMIGEVPSGLPAGLPEYPDSSLIGSTVTTDAGTESISVLRETSDSLDNVLLYYEENLDASPWEILLSTSQETFAAVQFGKTDDANLLGSIVIQSSGDGKSSTILTSVQFAASETPTAKPFELGASKPLPRGFPAEMPIYPDNTITDTAWARSTDALDFQVNFLTKSSSQDVADFYRKELASRGWTVTDQPSQTGQASATNLSFEGKTANLPGQTWSGDISINLFEEDPSYTQVRLQVRIGPEASPTPAAVPTP